MKNWVFMIKVELIILEVGGGAEWELLESK
jgi:hypothetical protein